MLLAICRQILLASTAAMAAVAAADQRPNPAIPERISWVSPAYPSDMREQHRGGGCSLKYIVGIQGEVTFVTPETITPGGEPFLEAAIEALCQWRYRPATYRGIPIPRRLTGTFNFQTGDTDGGSDEAPLSPAPSPAPRACGTTGTMAEQSHIAIDVASGGPSPLVVGGTIPSVADLVLSIPEAELEPLPGEDEDRVLLWWDRGIHADLRFLEKSKGFKVESIRYDFDKSSARTGEKLGSGSSCEDVAAAHGQPGRVFEFTDDAGKRWRRLDYRFGGTIARFQCVDGALSSLSIEDPLAND